MEQIKKTVGKVANQVSLQESKPPSLKRKLVCIACGKVFESDILGEYEIRVKGRDYCKYCSPRCQRIYKINNLMAEAGIPPKFPPFENDVSRFFPLKKGVYIHGKVGVGKTVLACNIARELIIDEGVRVKFVSFPKFIVTLQTSYRREQDDPQGLLDSVCQVPVLILDDIGAEKMTPFVKQSCYYLLNEREQWERRTIITSNFTLDELNEHIDARVSSRIAGMCVVVELKGKDRRVKP